MAPIFRSSSGRLILPGYGELPDGGLAAYWPLSYQHLDMTTGNSRAADISGVGFPLIGNSNFVRSLLQDTVTGGGVNFDGVANISAANSIISNNNNLPYTLSCWVRLNTLAATQYCLTLGTVGGGSEVALGFRTDVGPNKFIFSADGSSTFAASDVSPTAGRLYHLVGVAYSASLSVLFVDGVRQGATATANASGPIDTTAIGSSTSGGALTNGLIFECRMYRRALSDSEVFTLYQAGLRGLRSRKVGDEEWPALSAPAAPAGVGVGSASGTGTATGVGRSTIAAVGSAAGTGVATGVSGAVAASVGSAAGTGSAVAFSTGAVSAVGAASGVGVATALSQTAISAVGAAAGSGVATGISSVATTNRVKVWSGSAWVQKPVKVWSGSAWVTKPTKVWNGSAWV